MPILKSINELNEELAQLPEDEQEQALKLIRTRQMLGRRMPLDENKTSVPEPKVTPRKVAFFPPLDVACYLEGQEVDVMKTLATGCHMDSAALATIGSTGLLERLNAAGERASTIPGAYPHKVETAKRLMSLAIIHGYKACVVDGIPIVTIYDEATPGDLGKGVPYSLHSHRTDKVEILTVGEDISGNFMFWLTRHFEGINHKGDLEVPVHFTGRLTAQAVAGLRKVGGAGLERLFDRLGDVDVYPCLNLARLKEWLDRVEKGHHTDTVQGYPKLPSEDPLTKLVSHSDVIYRTIPAMTGLTQKDVASALGVRADQLRVLQKQIGYPEWAKSTDMSDFKAHLEKAKTMFGLTFEVHEDGVLTVTWNRN